MTTRDLEVSLKGWVRVGLPPSPPPPPCPAPCLDMSNDACYVTLLCNGNIILDYISAMGSLWQKAMSADIHGYVISRTVRDAFKIFSSLPDHKYVTSFFIT